MNTLRVYLDNCCLNRPFDDQRQTRVRLETEAILCIEQHIRDGRLDIAWSYMLDFENAANPFAERRDTITQWGSCAVVDIEATAAIVQQAQLLAHAGFKAKDALHISCAIAAGSHYFVTTDDDVLKRASAVQGTMVIDPPTLVRQENL